MSKHLRAEHGEEPAAGTCPKPNDQQHPWIQSQEVVRPCLGPEPLFLPVCSCARRPYRDLLRSIAMSSGVGHRSESNAYVR